MTILWSKWCLINSRSFPRIVRSFSNQLQIVFHISYTRRPFSSRLGHSSLMCSWKTAFPPKIKNVLNWCQWLKDWTHLFNQRSSQKESSSKVSCCATTFTVSDFAYLKGCDSVQHLKAQAFSFDLTKLLATRFGWLCEKENAFIRVHKKPAFCEFFPPCKINQLFKTKGESCPRENIWDTIWILKY